MKKNRFATYFFLSALVHIGLLLGSDAFLETPSRVISIPIEPIPVVAVILEGDDVSLQAQPVFGEQISTTRVLETKSQVSKGTEARLRIRDLAGPIPKEGNFEPSLSVNSAPTLGVLLRSREGKEIVSKPIVSALARPRMRLPPMQHLQLSEPVPLEVEVPEGLVEAETGGVEPYSQTYKKTETPVGRNRPRADSVSELPPLPTIESPSMPERREMVLPASGDIPTEKIEADLPLAPRKERAAIPRPMAPIEEPAILNLETGVSFPVPDFGKGATFLFVLDTSGSVKGAPLGGIKRSAREFTGLMGPNDRAGIMTFNDTVELVRPFTSEKRILRREINNVRTKGTQTVLFDALVGAIKIVQREDRDGKFLILFSDGKDEGSRSTLPEVIENIRLTGVSILCVGYSRVERKHLDTLKIIAAEGGGVFADAPQFHDVIKLYKAARDTNVKTVKSRSSQTP